MFIKKGGVNNNSRAFISIGCLGGDQGLYWKWESFILFNLFYVSKYLMLTRFFRIIFRASAQVSR